MKGQGRTLHLASELSFASCFGSVALLQLLGADIKAPSTLGPVMWGPQDAFIQLYGGRGPRAALAAEGTMERKALISPVMDTLLLKGGADGRNWGPGTQVFFLLLSFVNCW